MHPYKHRDWYFVAMAGALVLLGVAAWYVPGVYSVLHAAINIFAGGRSGVKVFLFLAYAALLCVIAFVVSGREIRAVREASRGGVVWAASFAPLAWGFISLVYLFFVYRLSFQSMAVIMRLTEVSSTRLLHNHVLKGIFGALLSWWGLGQSESVDTGLAYVGLVPWPLLCIGALLFCIAFVGHLYFFTHQTGKFPRGRARVVWTIAYGVVSFTILKNCIDGGLFNYETAAALSAFGMMIASGRRGAIRFALWCIVSYSFAYTVLLLFGVIPDIAAYGNVMYKYAALLGTFWVLWELSLPSMRRVHVFILLLCVLSLYPFLATDRALAEYRALAIRPDTGALIASYSEIHDAAFTAIETIGTLHIYTYIPKVPETVGALLRRQGLLDNLHPVAVPWRDCVPSGPSISYRFTLLVFRPLQRLQYDVSGVKVSAREMEPAGPKGSTVYSIHAEVAPCMPRHVNVLQESLTSMGAGDSILSQFEAE